MLQLKNITKIKEILDIAYKYVKTNIPLSYAKDYIPYALEFSTENIQTGTLPGTSAKINGLWFYKANKTKTNELVQELFEIKEQEIEQDDTKIKENAKIKIELVNSSGTTSTLSAVETLLEKQGYTISKVIETSSTKNTAIINNNQVNQQIVEEIQALLNKGVIQNSNNGSSAADITIVIGTNYNE